MTSGEWDPACATPEPDDDELFELVAPVVVAAREPASKPRALTQGQGQLDAQRAAELLFDRHHRRTFHWCRAVLGDAELAADTVNELFLDLLQQRRPREAGHRFATWLYLAARQRSLIQLRRRRDRELGDDPLEQALAHALSEDESLYDVGRAELDRAIQAACLEYLTPREQDVVHMRYVWGMKPEQITELLRLGGMSGGRSHLHSAEKKLRIALRGRFKASGKRTPGGAA